MINVRDHSLHQIWFAYWFDYFAKRSNNFLIQMRLDKDDFTESLLICPEGTTSLLQRFQVEDGRTKYELSMWSHEVMGIIWWKIYQIEETMANAFNWDVEHHRESKSAGIAQIISSRLLRGFQMKNPVKYFHRGFSSALRLLCAIGRYFLFIDWFNFNIYEMLASSIVSPHQYHPLLINYYEPINRRKCISTI